MKKPTNLRDFYWWLKGVTASEYSLYPSTQIWTAIKETLDSLPPEESSVSPYAQQLSSHTVTYNSQDKSW